MNWWDEIAHGRITAVVQNGGKRGGKKGELQSDADVYVKCCCGDDDKTSLRLDEADQPPSPFG